MLIEEKKKFSELEEKLRQVVSKQWEHLRKTVKLKSIHPVFWGHRTRTLRRSRHYAGFSLPPHRQQVLPQRHQIPPHSQQKPPQPVPRPPAGVQNRDEYTNKSRILTCYEDGDWQVGESGDDETSSEISSEGIVVSREIFAEVNALDNEPLYQGTTNSPTAGIEGLIYEDDITSVSHSDKDVETDEEIFPEVREDAEQDKEISPEEFVQAMTAHPPRFLTIMEARDVLGAQAADEWLANPVYQEEYESYEDDACEQFDNDVPGDVDDCLQSSASVQDPYPAEFTDFYANYEEGAEYLYYRDEDDTEADVYEEDGN